MVICMMLLGVLHVFPMFITSVYATCVLHVLLHMQYVCTGVKRVYYTCYTQVLQMYVSYICNTLKHQTCIACVLHMYYMYGIIASISRC